MLRYFKLAALLLVAWCVMVVAHEAGHVVGGWLGGGTLQYAELRPWHLPHSLFAPDPRPLLTLWSGPLFGIALPLTAALVLQRLTTPSLDRLRGPMWFVADFCLLANGTYLAAAWLSGDRHLDTPRLLSAGAHPATIALYCTATIPLGYIRFRRDGLALLQRTN